MFLDMFSESYEEGRLSLMGQEDEPIFRGYNKFFQISLNFWLSFTKYLLRFTRNSYDKKSCFIWPYLRSVCQEIIAMQFGMT